MIPGRRVVPPRKRLPAVRLDSIWRPTASSFMACANLAGNSRQESLAENEAVHRQPPWPPQGCFGFPELGLVCARGDTVNHIAPTWTCKACSHGLACACSQRGDGLGRASPEAMCTAGAVAGDTRAPGQQSPHHGQGCTAAPCEHCADCRDVFLHRDSGVDPASTARRLGPAPRPPEKNLFFSMKIQFKPSFFQLPRCLEIEDFNARQ